MVQPNGLTVIELHSALLPRAREQVEQILAHELKGQIASNQHCFINLPFPLASSNREAATPTFSWADERVAAIAAVVDEALVQLGFSEEEQTDMKKRANVIVREYRKGQSISFHTDELECASVVVGVVLQNECAQQRGLVLTRGNDTFVLEERCGTAFAMRDEARYAWKHGLPPCTGRRISVTVRFFKRKVLDAWVAAGSQLCLAPPRSTLTAVTGAERVRVTLTENRNFQNCKAAVADPKGGLKGVLKLFKDKLRVKVSVVYLESGLAWGGDWSDLADGSVLYGARVGEPFAGKPVLVRPRDGAGTTKRPEDEIAAQIEIWEAWRYPKLSFFVEQANAQLSEDAQLENLGRDTAALGRRIAESHLSVPETRELVLALQKMVEDESNGYEWGFASETFEEGRSTTVGLMRDSGHVISFSVEGAPPLKGAHKADGPLWQLEGGLNNPVNQDPNFAVHAVPKKVHASAAVVRGAWTDRDEPQVHTKAKERKNMYQSKRGVVVTEALIGFAGSVWCSSYFLCRVELDGQVFTSSAHAVMVQQAQLFGDAARAAELQALGNDSAPHKAFDHKAPKTGVRRVANFDKDEWERFRVRLMFRSTYAKFAQNTGLKQRMLQCFPRSYVEATSDPMWGCGILLSNPQWQKKKSWTGPNLMGRILTAVARLLHASEHGENRRAYLEALPEWKQQLGARWREACRAFVEASLEPRFPPPHWPGTERLEQLAARLDTVDLEARDDPDEEALLFCLEGCLGMRM